MASFLLAVTTETALSLGLIFIIGAGLAAFTPVVLGMLQELSPEKLKGRIFSIVNTAAMSTSMIGMVAFGWSTDRLGPQTSLFGMAAIFSVTAGVSLLLWKLGDLSSLQSGLSEQRTASHVGVLDRSGEGS